jgi:(p)ppGpp synthase/HD superfamily hydrolase
VISINTFKNRYSANKHWLEFLTTVNAKSVLNRFLKTQQKDEILKKHTDELNVFLEKYGLPKYEGSNDKISKTYSKTEFEKKMVEVLDKKLTYSQIIKAVYPKEWDTINKMTNS